MSKHLSTDQALNLVQQIANREGRRRTSAINALEQTVNTKLAEKVDSATYLQGMATKANKTEVYTKDEADAAITTKVNQASHLKKVKATAEEIEAYIADPSTAEKDTIYLLKDTTATGDDKFKEYTVLGTGQDITFECIGDTTTDLSDYVKTSDIEWASNADIESIINSVYGNIVTLSISVPSDEAAGDLWGKQVSDLQENVVVGTDLVSGTLKYISDYSSAWGAGEDSGNYLVLKAATNITADRITVEVVGGDHGERTLDSDGIAVLRIKNTAQSVRFKAYLGTDLDVKTFALTGLTLTPAE
jgi:peptidyl-tRNA hydrolase